MGIKLSSPGESAGLVMARGRWNTMARPLATMKHGRQTLLEVPGVIHLLACRHPNVLDGRSGLFD